MLEKIRIYEQGLEISPCKMTRVANCPISHRYDERKYYDPDIDYTDKIPLADDETSRGIIAHRYAAAVLNKDSDAIDEIVATGMVDDKILDAVERYVDFIYDILPGIDQQPELKVETKLELDFLYVGCYGRADVIIDSKDTLYIVDLKYGWQEVTANENYQLLAYAVGAQNISKRRHEHIKLYTFNATNGKVHKWELSREDAAEKSEWMRIRIRAALNNKRFINAGPWCDGCNNRDECGAWYNQFDNNIRPAEYMTSDSWKQACEWLLETGKKKNIDRLRANVIKKIEEGVIDDKYVEKSNRYKWEDDQDLEVTEYLQNIGLDFKDFTKRVLLSPSQMRDKFGKNKVDSIIYKKGKHIIRHTIKRKPTI